MKTLLHFHFPVFLFIFFYRLFACPNRLGREVQEQAHMLAGAADQGHIRPKRPIT